MVFPSSLCHLNLFNIPYTAPLQNGAGHNKPIFNSFYGFRFSFRFRPFPCFHCPASPCRLLLIYRQAFGSISFAYEYILPFTFCSLYFASLMLAR